jgi:benzoyl-CoA reductase/2-hydroxyglutaryl-CoA dehydratase subunit BcrC/BadD/HgdB
MIKQFAAIIQKYYSNFSRKAGSGRTSDRPLAWVTSFAPIEIVHALDMEYVFPESYAAVIAASRKGDEYIGKAYEMNMDPSVCSYSTCFNGSYFSSTGPRGVPFRPDVLIATNNQCNTLAGWWNHLSLELDVPLFVIDYPGEQKEKESAHRYVRQQHERLIAFLEGLSGARLNEDRLRQGIDNSRRSVGEWKKFLALRNTRYIPCQVSFDYILPLIVARCKEETGDFYNEFAAEYSEEAPLLTDEKRLLWYGYPLWYHHKRYIEKFETERIKIVADDYSSWWNLDYTGDTWEEQLVAAYNYTYLNRDLEFKKRFLDDLVKYYAIDGIIFNANRSCKRESSLVVPLKQSVNLPSVVVNSDMIDGKYYNVDAENLNYDIFGEIL